MSEHRDVPVAYVTKWATTRGILVVKGGKETEGGYFNDGIWIFVSPSQWTEDRETAEFRYRSALLKASQAAFKKHKALMEAINAPPKYTEES